jgi:hypothetical protein
VKPGRHLQSRQRLAGERALPQTRILMTTETAAALPRLDPYRRDAAIGGMKASAR